MYTTSIYTLTAVAILADGTIHTHTLTDVPATVANQFTAFWTRRGYAVSSKRR